MAPQLLRAHRHGHEQALLVSRAGTPKRAGIDPRVGSRHAHEVPHAWHHGTGRTFPRHVHHRPMQLTERGPMACAWYLPLVVPASCRQQTDACRGIGHRRPAHRAGTARRVVLGCRMLDERRWLR